MKNLEHKNKPAITLLAIICYLGSGLLLSCSEGEKTLFERLSEGKTGISFQNTLKESEEFNVLTYSYFYNGGGVAIGDINNDSLPDIYFTGNLVSSHLYLNKGDFDFDNIAEEAGVSASGYWNTGVTMVDINNDGWLDIYVCRSAASNPQFRRNLLFINNKDLTFTEKASEYGIDDPAYSTQATFFDYDRDGDLDLFLLNHSQKEYSNFQTTIGLYKNRNNTYFGDKLYKNENGKFVDVSKEAGIISNVLGFGLGVSVADFNEDGWMDIYVSNDFNEEDYLYINQQNGSFKESIRGYMNHVSLFSMGSDAADINNDGKTDLITLDMLPADNYRIKMTSGADNADKYKLLLGQGFHKQTMRNMLQINEGNGVFNEIGQYSGISNTDWSWSALFADYDLDGWQDLFITNGYLRDYTNMEFLSYTVDQKLKSSEEPDLQALLSKMPKIEVPNRIFKNLEGNQFKDSGKEWGIKQAYLSNGAAYGDLDRDGDLDLVVNNINDFASIYRNNAIELGLGSSSIVILESSKAKIGSKVELFAAGSRQQRVLMPNRGYQSSVEPILHFGISDPNSGIDSIRVQWPDGNIEIFGPQKLGKIRLSQGKGRLVSSKESDPASLFIEADVLEYQHKEDDFNDFKIQSLLPKYYSRQGPAIHVSDLNGDKLQDVIIGGALGQETQIFWGTRSGKLELQDIPDLVLDKTYEDIDLLSTDIDSDGDQDLVVLSTRHKVPDNDQNYALRLYVNEGNKKFRRSDSFPALAIHASSITSGDFDQDGDLDFFVGSAYAQGKYPSPGGNYILLNQGGEQFSLIQDLPFQDMHISEANWVDCDKDQVEELILIGEWERLSIWAFDDGEWILEKEANELGWWNSVLCVNLDGDPELEIVCGNWGLNSQLNASESEPIINYYGDFDNNGSIDPIMTSYHDHISYPFLPRDDMLGQLASLKKNFPDYTSYASFTSEDLKQLFPNYMTDTINFLKTIIYDIKENKLVPIELPAEAQLSTIHAISIIDYDKDGDSDLILSGNDLNNRVKIGEIDANHGLLLENQGNLKFQALTSEASGFKVKGAVRDSEILKIGEKTFILFGVNDGKLKSYQLKD